MNIKKLVGRVVQLPFVQRLAGALKRIPFKRLISPPPFLVKGASAIKGYIDNVLYPPGPPEIAAEDLFDMVIDDTEFYWHLQSVLGDHEWKKGWELEIAVEVRRYLQLNESKIEAKFSNGLKIGLNNSQTVAGKVVNYLRPSRPVDIDLHSQV